MIKKILLGVAVVIVILVLIVALQPSDYRISRSAKIAAAPPEVFVQVNDFHNWQAWSPWAKRDPKAKATFEGPDAGMGAIFRWAGNDEVGEGNMTITESKPSEVIQIDLRFIKPFEDWANTEFTFKPEGNQTEVTWTMTGKRGFMGKAVCLFMNMDKMVGSDFEQGLANMKTIVEDKSKN